MSWASGGIAAAVGRDCRATHTIHQFTSGSGDATFYLLGPGHTFKQKVRLGQDIAIGADQLDAAGRYLAILCSTA